MNVVLRDRYLRIGMLYRVDKETPTRIYGERVKGGYWSPKYVDISAVLYRDVSPEQYEQLVSLAAEADKRRAEVLEQNGEWFERRAAAVLRAAYVAEQGGEIP